ncbi:MAG: phenylacetate--CoA ligase family protein [Calditrichales bacterium]|nr:MAG: phenylacetate--CoA ligase family protein [Calditrichales bacterium]
MTPLLKKYDMFRLIYNRLPDQIKPGYGVYASTRRLILKTERFDQDQWKAYHFNQLSGLIGYAWEQIPGYRDLWSGAGFNPDQFKSLDDMRRIPYLTKDILKQDITLFTNFKSGKVIKTTTGGSVGIPLTFYQAQKNRLIEKAFIHDLWSRRYPPISLSTHSTILRGRKTRGTHHYDPMHGLLLSAFELTLENVKLFLEAIEKCKNPLLHAYPSALYVMATMMRDNHLSLHHHFEGIMLGSEPLYDYQRERISEVFNTPITHWYGLGEKTVLAGNCETDNRFHIYPQYGYAELLDKHGNHVKIGESGEIIGSAYWNRTTPFIRYRSLDYAVRGEDSCRDCGRNYPLLERIEGRLQEFIVGKSGKLIALTGVSIICGQFDEVEQFRFKQQTPGIIEFTYIRKPHVSLVNEKFIADSLGSKLGVEFNLSLREVKEIHRTISGKLKYLDQELDINKFL